MSGEPRSTTGGDDDAHAGEPLPVPGRPRPWTPAAAMEPVPPLAPPPARPSATTRVRSDGEKAVMERRLRVLLLLAVLAVVAILVVTLVISR